MANTDSEGGTGGGSSFISWLRYNLSVTTFLYGVVCAAVGGVIVGTWRVAHYEFRLESLESWQSENAPDVKKLGGMEGTQADSHTLLMGINAKIDEGVIDRNKLTNDFNDFKFKTAGDIGIINGRISVLEDKAKWLGDFVHDNIPLIGSTQTSSGGRQVAGGRR